MEEYIYKVKFRYCDTTYKRNFGIGSEDELLDFFDRFFADDYLYDVVSDWLAEKHIAGDMFKKGSLTIFLADK